MQVTLFLSVNINIRYIFVYMQTMLDNELHNLFQMGFDSCPVDNLGPNGNLQKFV